MSDLHFTDWPVPAPKAVMALVHGFGEHAGRYAPMAAHLNAQDIAVIAVDLPGHGQTPGKRGVISGYDDFRNALAALLAAARTRYPDVPLILYGHSMGGGVVLDHGLRGVDDVPIIASAPLIALPDPVPGPVRVFAKLMGKIAPKGTMGQPLSGEKISTLPEEQRRYEADPLNHGRLGFRLAVAMVENGEAIAARAAEWDRPLLLLHAKHDELTAFEGSEDFANAARQVDFHAYENSAHEMHNDVPRPDVYARMTNFILRHATEATV